MPNERTKYLHEIGSNGSFPLIFGGILDISIVFHAGVIKSATELGMGPASRPPDPPRVRGGESKAWHWAGRRFV